MTMRALLPILLGALFAGPALAQDHSCYCTLPDRPVVTEKYITRTTVIEDCDEPVCTRYAPVPHRPVPWHPRPHPRPQPGPSAPPAPVTPKPGDNIADKQSVTAGGTTINIYNTPPGQGPAPVPPVTPPAPDRPDTRPAAGGSNVIYAGDRDIWLPGGWAGLPGWLPVLLAILIALGALWVALRGSRGSRDVSHRERLESSPHDHDLTDLHAQLRAKDSEIERINAQLAAMARDSARARGESAAPPAQTLTMVEDAGLVAAGTVAGAAVARGHAAADSPAHPAPSAADLHESLRQRDRDLAAFKRELADMRRDLDAQRPVSARTRTVESASEATEERVVRDSTAAGAAVASHHGKRSEMIDEAEWSVTHYRVVIGDARARKHDRPQARLDIIRLSDLMLTHHSDNAEAVCYAHVSKAEALAERGDHGAALAECDTVIAHHGASTAKAVRTQLAEAHFTKAAIHAQVGDVAHCCAALEAWHQANGVFDKHRVTEDARFARVIEITEFRDYIAQK